MSAIITMVKELQSKRKVSSVNILDTMRSMCVGGG